MTLEAPAQNGDMLAQADCLGHTMIVAPTEFIDHIQTKNTKPGEKSPAIRVNVADFADPDNPAVYRGVLWFGVISGNLRRQIGSFLACRMAQGTASPGRNAPWTLDDVTGEADWMAFMNAWLDNTEAGAQFQIDAISDAQAAAQTKAEAPAPTPQVAATTQAPAPAAPAAPPARPAAPPANRPAPAPVQAAPAPAPQTAPAAAPDLASVLGGLAPEEAAKIAAILAQQGNAAH